jgi:phage-related protein
LADTEKKIKVVFYQTASGNEPVRDWLKEDVSEDERKVIGADIMTVEYGWPIGMPVSRSLGNGLYEVRCSLPGKKIARVIFCIEEGMMVLLHAFIKKTQKTPKSDLELAQKRKKEMDL